MTSRASVEVHFVDLEGSVRRIWFHVLDQSSFQSRTSRQVLYQGCQRGHECFRSVSVGSYSTYFVSSRTLWSARELTRIHLRIGGWWLAPKSTVLSEISLSPSRLKNFLVRRARVRDDPGRSPQIELEPERSFDGPLSGQCVCEQTSGVLRHTESVRGDKVQEQDLRQALEQKSRAPPARPRCDITARSHARRPKCQDDQVQTLRTVADARSNDPVRSVVFRKQISLSDGSSRSVAHHEAVGVRSFVLAMSHLELIASRPPSRPRNGTTSCTVTANLKRGLRVLRMFEQSRLFYGGFQQIATTAIVPFCTGLLQHSSLAFSGWFGGSRQTVKSRHFVPTNW